MKITINISSHPTRCIVKEHDGTFTRCPMLGCRSFGQIPVCLLGENVDLFEDDKNRVLKSDRCIAATKTKKWAKEMEI